MPAVKEKANATTVTLKGNPITLAGTPVKVGQDAPDVTLVANDLSEVKLSSFKGKNVILVAMPSIDTPVCDTEGKRFNEEAGKLKDVTVLTITADLPFAQKRWCGATNAKNIQTLSDHREAAFGQSYGILIKNLRLLARAVYIVDKKGKIRYIQVVNEVAQEPDYAAVLKAVKEL